MAITDQETARFWPKVDVRGVDDCWPWTAGLDERGYGLFNWGPFRENREFSYTQRYAHRFSYELHYGPIPRGDRPSDSCVLHRCDFPACVNPKHLFFGTQADNASDRNQKGREAHLHGEQNGSAKLTENEASEIRSRYAAGGIYLWELGEEFGVSTSTISRVVLRKTWRLTFP